MFKIKIPIKPPEPPTEEERLEDIRKWIEKHDAYNMTGEEIAKAMFIEAVENTKWAEDAYPGIKERMLAIARGEFDEIVDKDKGSAS